jgi:hypothetical protein
MPMFPHPHTTKAECVLLWPLACTAAARRRCKKPNGLAAGPPLQGFARVQVRASVTQPEKLHRYVTNTFNFDFSYDLRQDEQGRPVPPKRVLPLTGVSA